jgi:hypothetical protein
MGDRELPIDVEPTFDQPFDHLSGMKIEIQLDQLYSSTVKGTPFLPAQQPPKDRLDVLLVGIFQNKSGSGHHSSADLAQCPDGIYQVVNGSYHGSRVEHVGTERELIHVADYIDKSVAVPQPGLSQFQLCAGVIQQNDLLEALVAQGITARTGPNFQ